MYSGVGELPKWLKPPSKITGDWLLKTGLPVVGVTAAVVAAASPKARNFFSNVLDFFKSSGMQAGAAEALASKVASGQEPVPPELASRMQAGMLGGFGMPLAILGIGGVALMMFMPQKGRGKRRGR